MINFKELSESIHDACIFARLEALCKQRLHELAETDMEQTEWLENIESLLVLHEQLTNKQRPIVSKALMQQLLREELKSQRINAGYIRYIISKCK